MRGGGGWMTEILLQRKIWVVISSMTNDPVRRGAEEEVRTAAALTARIIEGNIWESADERGEDGGRTDIWNSLLLDCWKKQGGKGRRGETRRSKTLQFNKKMHNFEHRAGQDVCQCVLFKGHTHTHTFGDLWPPVFSKLLFFRCNSILRHGAGTDLQLLCP